MIAEISAGKLPLYGKREGNSEIKVMRLLEGHVWPIYSQNMHITCKILVEVVIIEDDHIMRECISNSNDRLIRKLCHLDLMYKIKSLFKENLSV